jgi:fructose-1,6-bisphosphatase/sedoheptulose 1,7-bisphosphatase-like protein
MTSQKSQGQIKRNITMGPVRVTEAAVARGVDINKVYTTEEIVGGEDVFFTATGVSSGELLKGVRYFSGGAQT